MIADRSRRMAVMIGVGHVVRAMENASAQRGLWKLMLRLPALRGQLQILSVRNTDLRSLCDAFDDASSTLSRLYKEVPMNPKMIAEYETVCSEIESEVVELCLSLGQKQL